MSCLLSCQDFAFFEKKNITSNHVFLQVLGIDSEFCNVEALITGIVDNYPQTLLKHRRKFTVGMCFLMFIAGIPMCTNVSTKTYILFLIIFF